jgi:hypothetical protein
VGSFALSATFLILALLALTEGFRQARKRGILTASFWQTFAEYPGYRVRHLLTPAALVLSGTFFLGAGGINLFLWLRAFYAARLGHPFP